MNRHFLLRYNRRTGVLATPIAFAGADGGRRALEARFDAEQSADPDMEIVVIEAKNEAAMRRTHPRYFRTVAELVGDTRFVAHA